MSAHNNSYNAQHKSTFFRNYTPQLIQGFFPNKLLNYLAKSLQYSWNLLTLFLIKVYMLILNNKMKMA